MVGFLVGLAVLLVGTVVVFWRRVLMRPRLEFRGVQDEEVGILYRAEGVRINTDAQFLWLEVYNAGRVPATGCSVVVTGVDFNGEAVLSKHDRLQWKYSDDFTPRDIPAGTPGVEVNLAKVDGVDHRLQIMSERGQRGQRFANYGRYGISLVAAAPTLFVSPAFLRVEIEYGPGSPLPTLTITKFETRTRWLNIRAA